jgi:hypothetical protein
MSLLSLYLCLSFVMFGFLMVIWNRSDPFNLILKVAFGR